MSKRRSSLESRFLNQSMNYFIATVQGMNKTHLKLTLTDVLQINDDGTSEIVAPHVHVFGISKNILKKLNMYDMISFNAIPEKYYKTNERGIIISNYSFNYITNIKLIGVGQCNG